MYMKLDKIPCNSMHRIFLCKYLIRIKIIQDNVLDNMNTYVKIKMIKAISSIIIQKTCFISIFKLKNHMNFKYL